MAAIQFKSTAVDCPIASYKMVQSPTDTISFNHSCHLFIESFVNDCIKRVHIFLCLEVLSILVRLAIRSMIEWP